jgi:hypothetical protein
MVSGRTILVATIVCLVATSGLAVDRTILGTKLILNDKGNRSKLVFVSKDDLLEVPTGDQSPDVVGATLTVRNPVTGRSGTTVLPAVFWRLNRSGTTFKYDDGTIKVKFRNRRLLKIKAQSTIIALLGEPQGEMSLVLEIGDERYCALFDPFSVRKDKPCLFKAKRAAAPLECPGGAASPSGAFVLGMESINELTGGER